MSELERLIREQSELTFLHQLVQIATTILGDVQIILFGSRARGDYHRRSDVDVLIDCARLDDRSWAILVSELEDLPTLLPIDLVRWDQVEADFLNRARSEGVLLHE